MPNESGPASGECFNPPGLPTFNNDASWGEIRCLERDMPLAIHLPSSERNVNIFGHNLYERPENTVLSYQKLLARLRQELRDYDLDLGAMELVDVDRNMRVLNQRSLINYFRVAIIHGAQKLQFSLLPTESRRNSHGNTPAGGIAAALQKTGESSDMGARGIFGPSGLVHPVYSNPRPGQIRLAHRPSPAIPLTSATVRHTSTSASAICPPTSAAASQPPQPARIPPQPTPHLAFATPASQVTQRGDPTPLPSSPMDLPTSPLASTASLPASAPLLRLDIANPPTLTSFSALTAPVTSSPPPSGSHASVPAYSAGASIPPASPLPLSTADNISYRSPAPQSANLTPPSHNPAPCRIPPGRTPTSVRVLRPRLVAPSKSPSSIKEENRSPTSSGTRRSGRISKRPVRYGQSDLVPSTIPRPHIHNTPLANSRTSTALKVHATARTANSNVGRNASPIMIDTDNDEDDNKKANSDRDLSSVASAIIIDSDSDKDNDENDEDSAGDLSSVASPIVIDSDSDKDGDENDEDSDGDLSSVNCDDIRDKDFEMNDCEQVDDDEDSDEEHEGLEFEEEGLGHDSDQEQNYDQKDGRGEDDRGEEEEEEDISPQPAWKRRRATRTTAGLEDDRDKEEEEEEAEYISPRQARKRRRATRSTAPQKRPRAASPIDSDTILGEEGEVIDNYLVATVTESLSAMGEAGLQYPVANEALSPDDR